MLPKGETTGPSCALESFGVVGVYHGHLCSACVRVCCRFNNTRLARQCAAQVQGAATGHATSLTPRECGRMLYSEGGIASLFRGTCFRHVSTFLPSCLPYAGRQRNLEIVDGCGTEEVIQPSQKTSYGKHILTPIRA
jgi:hypothetical protein